jgi:RNA recognition motif-containing protein
MSNRLYVGNLSYSVTKESLRSAFESFGSVTDVHVVSDRTTGQSRGFGFVTLSTADEARAAMAAMNGASHEGRALRVNEAEERSERPDGRQGGGARRNRG